MSEIKHTPGPWFAIENCCFWEIRTSEFEYGGEQIGDACASGFIGGAEDNPVEVANARLMAAAPELLEALEAMLAIYPYPDNDTTDAAKRAIAKATGSQS
jgi:hypothetical protein